MAYMPRIIEKSYIWCLCQISFDFKKVWLVISYSLLIQLTQQMFMGMLQGGQYHVVSTKADYQHSNPPAVTY